MAAIMGPPTRGLLSDMIFRTSRVLGRAVSGGTALLLLAATACSAPAPAAPPTAAPAQPTPAAKTYTIGISQLIPHPVLDVYRQGALEALAAQGFVEGKNLTIDFQNAQ